MLPLVASRSFFEVSLLSFSSRPNWSAVVDCGLLISNQFLEAFDCLLFFVAVLTTLPCRRFGYIPFILSPFGIVAVLVSPFWLSTFWFVAVLTRHRRVCRPIIGGASCNPIPVSTSRRTGVERSPTPVQQLGTHYLTGLRTLTFCYLLLYVISQDLLLFLLAHFKRVWDASQKRAI